MKKYKAKIMSFDSPNLNGRIYSSEMMKNEIEKFNERIKNNGPALGMITMFDDQFRDLSLAKVSHKIESVRLSDDMKSMVGDITILDTPDGKMLQKMLSSGDFGCNVVGYGNVDSCTHHVENYNLNRIDIIPIEQCAWPESKLKEVK